MLGIRPGNLHRAGCGTGLGQQQRFRVVIANEKICGGPLAQHDTVNRRGIRKLVGGNKEIALVRIGVRPTSRPIGVFDHVLGNGHDNGRAVRDCDGGSGHGRPLRHLAQQNGGRNRRHIGRVAAAG